LCQFHSQSKALNALFEALVQQDHSDVVAIDGSAINAYKHAAPKKDFVDDGHHASTQAIPLIE
jgi:hypothetical protein